MRACVWLQPSNLLLNSECQVKLADFGLARSVAQLEADDGPSPILTDYVATRWCRTALGLQGPDRHLEFSGFSAYARSLPFGIHHSFAHMRPSPAMLSLRPSFNSDKRFTSQDIIETKRQTPIVRFMAAGTVHLRSCWDPRSTRTASTCGRQACSSILKPKLALCLPTTRSLIPG